MFQRMEPSSLPQEIIANAKALPRVDVPFAAGDVGLGLWAEKPGFEFESSVRSWYL